MSRIQGKSTNKLSNETTQTFLKAKFWAGCIGDSVDTGILAHEGKLSVKGVREQGVGGRPDHFHGATFLGSQGGQSLGENEES